MVKRSHMWIKMHSLRPQTIQLTGSTLGGKNRYKTRFAGINVPFAYLFKAIYTFIVF